jgi:hypothetical protein
MLEQTVDSRVEDASGVELVADGDPTSCGDDGAALIVELITCLQAAEVGSGLVEATCHPEEVDPVGAGLPRHDRVVQVPPKP